MAKLLSHPNNAIRQAVVQAMSVAEVEVAVTPKEESVQDKIAKSSEKQGKYAQLSRYQLFYAILLNVQGPTGVPKSLAKKFLPCKTRYALVFFVFPPKRSYLRWLARLRAHIPSMFRVTMAESG